MRHREICFYAVLALLALLCTPARGCSAGGGICINGTECGDNGECVEFQCRCDDTHAGDFCQNRRQLKRTAFLLSFFLGPTGAGRFYLGHTASAIGKLILTLVILCCGGSIFLGGCVCSSSVFDAFWKEGNKSNSEAGAGICLGLGVIASGCVWLIAIIIGCLVVFGISVWWIVDWALILSNDLCSSNGDLLRDF